MSTVRVVPTPRGSGLVQVTLVITLAQPGQASASASTSNSCSGVIARSTLLVNLYGAVSVKLTLMRSQETSSLWALLRCLTGAFADPHRDLRREQQVIF